MAKGSNIWVAGGYAQGSTSYNGFGAFTMGSFSVTPVDARFIGTSMKLTTSYAFMGAIELYYTPTISGSLALRTPRSTRRVPTTRSARSRSLARSRGARLPAS